ncbi:MAG: secretion protein HlyD [Chromatiales bacterium]|jgi:membrane fusion protein|nr:secretion protein HlyD [Chromatiales bacterium]
MSAPSHHEVRTPHSGEILKRNPPVVREPLFRPNVIAERQSQWLGTVLLAPTISHSLFVVFAAVAIAAILGLLFFAEFSRSEQVNGWLVPEHGLVRVVAPQPGVIMQVHVRDDEMVTAGAALITLSTELRSEASGATQKEIVRHLQDRRDSLIAERELHRKLLAGDVDGLTKRIWARDAERNHLAAEIEIQRSQVEFTRQVAARQREILDSGLTAAHHFESAESNRLEQAVKLRALERQLAAVGRERLGLLAERKALPIRNEAQLAGLDRDVAALEQELLAAEAHRQFVITATQAGTVTALRAEQGSSANTSTPLLSLVPANSELHAQLFVPSKAIGFIRPGQDVRLRYAAFPYQKFGHHQGVVSSISRSAVSPHELGAQLAGLTSMLSGDEPVYLVTVRLIKQNVVAYGEALSLQPGMQLQANVLIETRRLIEWVFDPLFTMTGK